MTVWGVGLIYLVAVALLLLFIYGVGESERGAQERSEDCDV